MERFALALAVTLSLAAPVAAQSLTILLPTLTFPTETVTPSTKGCSADLAKPVCELAE
ncbi:MAG: hypothetical protein MUE83_05225 [Tabrizicola sp.]|nr:hypothetical protein [Tabrizicola sp.]